MWYAICGLEWRTTASISGTASGGITTGTEWEVTKPRVRSRDLVDELVRALTQRTLSGWGDELREALAGTLREIGERSDQRPVGADVLEKVLTQEPQAGDGSSRSGPRLQPVAIEAAWNKPTKTLRISVSTERRTGMAVAKETSRLIADGPDWTLPEVQSKIVATLADTCVSGVEIKSRTHIDRQGRPSRRTVTVRAAHAGRYVNVTVRSRLLAGRAPGRRLRMRLLR